MTNPPVSPFRGRVAPSPTGFLHIAVARAALYNWLSARKLGGQFILRIEDTDRTRYVEGSLDNIKSGLRWLGLEWDEGPDVGGPYGPYVQSERLPIYHAYIQTLLDSGHAYETYYSKDELDAIRDAVGEADPVAFNRRVRSMPEEEKARRREAGVRPAVLFKMPEEGETVVYDEIRGEIRFPNKSLRDPVLLKSDGFPTYHFAAMVDDGLMRITDVLRGVEWLPSLPLHVQVIQALGWETPRFYHLSLFLDPSGKGKMSKRKGSNEYPIFVHQLREMGYLPEALLNWIALMGWAETSGDREIYTVPELIEAFDLRRVRAAPAAVDYDKAEWLNGVHIRMLAPDDLARRIAPFMAAAGFDVTAEQIEPMVPLIQERMANLTEAVELLDFFFVTPPAPEGAELTPKKLTPADAAGELEAAREVLAGLEPFDAASIEAALRGMAEARGIKPGDLFTILRVALSSKRVAPPLFGTIACLGRETTLARIDRALGILQPA
ncbi:MAG: glutamate--tRNA ligase [Anaerolineae bacterium]